MLELKNVSKTYRPKKGQPVAALKNVSTAFGETGMVFILGKSGCGKSTLLNVIGGLDSFDSGEIIIKGKSSKEFSQGDFDSYRNTLVGFIFQEYNILDDFNVEKNIALALELQGKKATHEAVSSILKQVDLEEHSKRKTTELSGGQKQRIAIARALIKNPEIIIADEPTGALDSTTGIQVFDTLKQLSKNRLVIVVSHDHEFAERYGDRIITMVDGVIKTDETKRYIPPKEIGDGFNIVGNDTIHIEKGNKLNEKQKSAILKLITDAENDVMISADSKSNKNFRKILKVDDSGTSEKFEKSTEEDLKVKKFEGKDLKLIKSRLKFKDSFRMGASGLKAKPVRLIFTIILCFVAFAMFGLTHTIGSFNKVKTTTTSIVDSKISNLSFVRERGTSYDGNEEDMYYDEVKMRESDLADLIEATGIDFIPVYNSSEPYTNVIYLNDIFENSSKISSSSYYSQNLAGFAELSREEVENLGFTITGSGWANSPDEVVITKYFYEHFKEAGYKDPEDSLNSLKAEEITSESILIGKKINIQDKIYTIKAIIDTNLDESRYGSLKEEKDDISAIDYIMVREFRNVITYGYHSLLYVAEGVIDAFIEESYQNGISVDYNYSFIVDSSILERYHYIQHVFKLGEIGESYRLKTGVSEIGQAQIMFDVSKILESVNYDDANLGDIRLMYDNTKNSALGSYADEMPDDDSELLAFYAATDNSSKFEYSLFLRSDGYYENPFGPAGVDIIAQQLKTNVLDNDVYFEKLLNYVSDKYNYQIVYSNDMNSAINQSGAVEIVGFFIENSNVALSNIYADKTVVTDSLYNLIEKNEEYNGVYSFALAAMPTSESEIKKIVDFYYDNINNNTLKFRFTMKNEVTYIMEMVTNLLESLSKVFLYVGIGIAVFASLMMTSFIATSISYKKRDIGILRAVGARSKDVFGIFFNESLVIAIINFVLALVTAAVTTHLINNLLRNDYGIKITILNFGIVQALLILGISVFVALISSAIPVYRIAKKKPIDAINNR